MMKMTMEEIGITRFHTERVNWYTWVIMGYRLGVQEITKLSRHIESRDSRRL